jgi:hypothetical protein
MSNEGHGVPVDALDFFDMLSFSRRTLAGLSADPAAGGMGRCT